MGDAAQDFTPNIKRITYYTCNPRESGLLPHFIRSFRDSKALPLSPEGERHGAKQTTKCCCVIPA